MAGIGVGMKTLILPDEVEKAIDSLDETTKRYLVAWIILGQAEWQVDKLAGLSKGLLKADAIYALFEKFRDHNIPIAYKETTPLADVQ